MKAKYRKITDVQYDDCHTGVCGYLGYKIDYGTGRKYTCRDHIKFPEHIPPSQREKFVTIVVKKNKDIYKY